MANLTETSTYDAGVYQLETTDPVTGGSSGVANSPHKNLANRTNYLKAHVDALEAAAAGLAPIASPTFTGNPAAPTPALGDNDTSIATTAFVQGTLGGYLSKSVAGGSNVTLTAVEAGNGILRFTGVLTANINVIVPTSPTRPWVVVNDTTGAYTLTVKTSGGTGIAVEQGSPRVLACDGTNVIDTRGAATQTTSGVIEIATSAEVAAGTDAVRAITPAGLFSTLAKSHGASGYQKLPNGLIIQWGSYSNITTPLGVSSYYQAPDQSFPIAFPNACLQMCGSSILNFCIAQVFAASASQYTPRFSQSGGAGAINVDVHWIAVGY